MKTLAIFSLCLMSSLMGYSQTESKPVVGIPQFTSEVNSKYVSSVAEKVVQMVTNTRRFTIVDRTSYDKVRDELEFQKSEAFLDSKNTVKQGAALAAQSLIIGHVVKLSVYAMKNNDGSVKGYKASTAFILKVTDVESGQTTEATQFQTEVSPLMLSPESALNEALKSVEPALNSYFVKTFPLTTKIVKILTTQKDAAATVLVAGGKGFGFQEGDRLTVERIEMIDGKPYPNLIGEMKITKIAGPDFSEGIISKGGNEILAAFNSAEKLNCKLIVK